MLIAKILATNFGFVPDCLGTNFSEILIKIMSLKVLFAKWRPFCLGLNVLLMIVIWNKYSAVWYRITPGRS